MAFVCDGKWLTAGPGDFVFGPKNIPHGFKVTGTTPAQMLLLVSPGGFERFTKNLSEPAGTLPLAAGHRKARGGGSQLRG